MFGAKEQERDGEDLTPLRLRRADLKSSSMMHAKLFFLQLMWLRENIGHLEHM